MAQRPVSLPPPALTDPLTLDLYGLCPLLAKEVLVRLSTPRRRLLATRSDCFSLVLLSLLLTGCGGDGGGGSSSTGPEPLLGIGPEGGSARLAGGAVLIMVPAGALTTRVEFTASPVASVPGTELFVSGSAYEIGPAGTTFTTPVTLSLRVSMSSLPGGVLPEELGLFKVVGGVPQLTTNSVVSTSSSTVSGQITSLSTFGAWGLPVAYVEIAPDEVGLLTGTQIELLATPYAESGQVLPQRGVSWSSSDESVVTVEDGLVTGVASGTATITATSGSGTGSAVVTTGPFSCSLQSQIPEAECEALVAFYEATDGPGWTESSNWLETLDPCSWYGLVCSSDSRVQSVRLEDNQLTGPIPAEIGNLSSLQNLYLLRNQLTGSIPAEIGNLTNLEALTLSLNQLSGPIPAELGDLPALWVLALWNNQLTGTIPAEIGNLTGLKFLDLAGNQLTGAIPSEIGNLTALQRLYLPWNQLTGAIPAEIGNLTSLTHLWLDDNQFTGSIPVEIGNLTDLEVLDIQLNPLLTGPIPTEVGNLTNLRWLRLQRNQLTGPIPVEVGNLTNLEQLALARNQLTGTIPAEIGNLSSLSSLRLQVNLLTGVIPLEVAQKGEAMDQCTIDQSAGETNSVTLPDTEEYRAADSNGDGRICGLRFASGNSSR